MKKYLLVVSLLLFIINQGFSQFVDVGSGSYTTQFPGVDAAGRNTFPSGTPYTTGVAASKPVPTNDWWSAKIKNNHADNLFNYPFTLKTVNSGLVTTYIPWGVIDDVQPVVVGVAGLNAGAVNVSDFSDWTVTMDWSNSGHNFTTTAGIGMPFLYFTKNTNDVAQIKVNSGTVTVANEMLIIKDLRNGADFVVYAPLGSTWTQNGNVYTSNLNGKNYWSMAFIPLNASNVATVADEYKKYAYVFPVNTTTSWAYDSNTSVVRTDFSVETEVKEGSETNMLLGLLPHQWSNLAADSPVPASYSYKTVRGELKTLTGNSFSVENTFYGILPTLPNLVNYSDGFNPIELDKKIRNIENDGLATWTDSYNEGQVMNRLIQTARIADQMGNTEALNKMLETVKKRLEDWLDAKAGEVAFLFYYNSDWTAMIGYPAGHGQDGNLNDHHFHWGYFIHAAAFVEQYQPGWANQWGEMINLLVRDAASSDRNDAKFPFLRNFSPYAGHCWANGFASFPQGNDQESTSESMQFNSSLIHWGAITGNDEIRDLGIYLYTTEQSAVEEYWFDMYNRIFADNQQYSLVSRVWGNSYDNGTFWTSDIAASYGIEMYPIHGGSLYLGHNTEYVQKLWTEITQNTGILNNAANPNLWHDIMWEYLSFIDPAKAIELYNSYPGRELKFGISDAQTYHWLHAMNALGNVNTEITADYPLAASFNKDGVTTYVAHNYSSNPVTVTFSDGYMLDVPPNQMATSRDLEISGSISTNFNQAYANGSVNLLVELSSNNATNVEFFDGNTSLGSVSEAPYKLKAEKLSLGVHGFYARIYDGEAFNITNIVSVQVGEQVPYQSMLEIPGAIEAGHYDKFEGGVGQGISYVDVSQANEGGFRPGEYVDAVMDNQEGATVGWIASGEWLEYTVNIENAGVYELSFRYASGNEAGGGPFYLKLDDAAVSDATSVNYTGDWGTWASRTVSGIDMTAGQHILKVVFESGEFNLGKMTFTRTGDLSYVPPIADAGDNVIVLLPETTATLDGSQSYDPEGESLTYLWEQLYGPSVIEFSDNTAASPNVSNLEEGFYKCRLTVSDGTYSAKSELLVIVSATENLEPLVSISSPANNASFYEGNPILLAANASDLDGTIALVEFFDGDTKIGDIAESPYEIEWYGATEGEHQVTAKATDNDGATSTSAAITLIIEPTPPCTGEPENGEYTYEFSEDSSNPTLTFIPSSSGIGSPTCILYYGTSTSGPFPGYGVSPNVPFQINGEEGTVIYFYYTYSTPSGEHNTMDDMHSYEIGSCAGASTEYLSLSTNTITLNAAANSSATFDITANINWTASCDKDWITLSNSSGSENETITLTADENPTANSRTATITVSGADIQESISVAQNGNTTGIGEEHLNAVKIFPNPATNNISVNLPDGRNTVEIFDMNGKPHYQDKVSQNLLNISIKGFAKGIYYVKITNNEETYIQKLIIN